MFGLIAGPLLTAVPSLVRMAETLFSKPKSGAEKKAAVLKGLRAIIDSYAESAGAKDKKVSDDELGGMIETVVQQMAVDGKIGTGGETLYLVRGTVTQIKPAAV